MHPPKKFQPSPWVDRFLQWRLPSAQFEEVQGDMHELYGKWVEEAGERKAKWLYIFNALTFFRPLPKRSDSFQHKINQYSQANPFDMLRSYLTTAFRNLTRNRAYSTINVLGLTLGVTCCLLIFLIVRFERSFDTYHTNADKIYRIVTESHYPEGTMETSGTPLPMIQAIRTDFPQLEGATAVMGIDAMLVSVPATAKSDTPKRFKEEGKVALVEPQYFNFFDYQWIAGNQKNALAAPNSAILTEEYAKKYFGEVNPVGKMLRLNNAVDVQITGVVKSPPANTNFPFELLVSYASIKEKAFEIGNLEDWGTTNGNGQTYVMLPENFSPKQMEAQLIAFNAKHRSAQDAKVDKFLLQPLADIHFNEKLGNYNARTVSRQLLVALSIVGVFLLITACINFINLATAQAIKRAKEVGVRKVLGSSRAQLLGQFMGETAIITVLAILLSIGLVFLLIPPLNNVWNSQLPRELFADPTIWLFVLLLAVVVTLLAGFYPAVVLAGYQPIQALKGKISPTNAGDFTLRRSLVVLQFAISQVLIIGTIIITAQMDYFRNAPIGFNKDAVLQVPLPGNKSDQLVALRTKLLSFSGIRHVSYSWTTPASMDWYWNAVFKYDNAAENAPFEVSMRPADTAYFNTYNLQLVAGRKYQPSETIREFIVNKTFLRKMGIGNPQDVLGKTLTLNGVTAPIVGVVNDFNSRSMRESLQPVVLTTFQKNYYIVNIKLASENVAAIEQSLHHIEKSWTQTYPEHVFEYEFVDEMMARFYEREQRMGQFFRVFAGIAIFIGCLGLYGLVSFMAVQRVKEIGIRKVLGASVTHILWLFSKEFLRLIAIAFLVAAPIAYYVMKGWLQDFAYQIPFHAGYFLLALFASIGIALLTVGYRAIQASTANPVDSLRSQ
jgi:ABC-type antimicrobial peptide transport system permease subunit